MRFLTSGSSFPPSPPSSSARPHLFSPLRAPLTICFSVSLSHSWATEDPNPAASRAEAKRLLELGEQGIAKALDPEFVQRVRELDELEGVVAPRELSPEEEQQGQEQDEEPSAKRQRIEPSSAAAAAPPAQAAIEAAPAPSVASGILSAHAVDSLKYMASLREKRAAQPVAVVKAPTKSTGLGALADYGSDSD